MKNLVVLTGAGMSAESGISTFRDAGGLWDQYPVEQVAMMSGLISASASEMSVGLGRRVRKKMWLPIAIL